MYGPSLALGMKRGQRSNWGGYWPGTVLAAFLLLLLSGVVLAQATKPAATYDVGQKIEVREGDTWSAATVLKKEGRKYFIQYQGADQAEEWVTTDRMRAAGNTAGGAAPTTPSPTAPGAATPPVKPQPKGPVFSIGQKVEAKWGAFWYEVVLTNQRGEWWLVTYTNGKTREWVEPYRLRPIGSKVDKIGSCPPNPTVYHGEGPPQEKPGPAPKPFGSTQADEEALEAYKNDPTYKECRLVQGHRSGTPAPAVGGGGRMETGVGCGPGYRQTAAGGGGSEGTKRSDIRQDTERGHDAGCRGRGANLRQLYRFPGRRYADREN